MKKLKDGIEVSDDDKEVLDIMSKMRQSGIEVPEFEIKSEKNQMFPFVYFKEGSFHFWLIVYCPKKSDSGFCAFHIKNFLVKNKISMTWFIPFGVDPSELLVIIQDQVMGIAKQINYPYLIGVFFDKDFVGLKAIIPHDIKLS